MPGWSHLGRFSSKLASVTTGTILAAVRQRCGVHRTVSHWQVETVARGERCFRGASRCFERQHPLFCCLAACSFHSEQRTILNAARNARARANHTACEAGMPTFALRSAPARCCAADVPPAQLRCTSWSAARPKSCKREHALAALGKASIDAAAVRLAKTPRF